MENNLPNRKRTRLEKFDYGKHGAYFVTICTEGRRHILSEIVCDNDTAGQSTPSEAVGEGYPLPQLTFFGKIADRWINTIHEKYPNVSVERYVIMPNHIHLLLFVDNIGRGNPSPTISTVVGWFKFNSTKEINAIANTAGKRIYQRSFYDHIIRNQRDYDEVAKYIYENPMRWRFDKLYGEYS